MTVENRPALHPNATANELLAYADSYACTFLEMELAAMLQQVLDEKRSKDRNSSIEAKAPRPIINHM